MAVGFSSVPPINPNLNTTNRYGVPLYGVGLNILMPKLKHRFAVRVTNFGGVVRPIAFTQQVVTVGRPQIQFQNTQLHSYNNISYIAQKPEWQSIEITLRDDITNQVSSLVSTQVQYQMNHFTQDAAASGHDYKFELNIDTLDGSMNAINTLESWYLEGCYLEQVQYDSLDYSSSEATMITLTVRYDNATQGGERGVQIVPNGVTAT